MKLRARTIDTWVNRYPMPATPGVQPAPGANESSTGGMKYQMKNAICEGMVSVHQDPDDPAKPRGTDILGSRMLIDSVPDGSVLTVFGWDSRPGEVHNEGTSLIGPKIVVDQLHNVAVIEGRGSRGDSLVKRLHRSGIEDRRARRHSVPRRHGASRERSSSPSSSAR